MTVKIEVLNKTVTTKPTPKGSYQQLELAYKNLSFQGKVEGRKIMSFGNTAAAFKELANANTGDVFEVEVIKNEKTGYNDWVSAKKSSVVPNAGQSAPSVQNIQSASPIRNTYETPEERAKKQIYIVRQSSISSAIALLSVGSKSPPKTSDVIGVAKELEDYVFGQAAENAAVDQDIQTFGDLEDVPL